MKDYQTEESWPEYRDEQMTISDPVCKIKHKIHVHQNKLPAVTQISIPCWTFLELCCFTWGKDLLHGLALPHHEQFLCKLLTVFRCSFPRCYCGLFTATPATLSSTQAASSPMPSSSAPYYSDSRIRQRVLENKTLQNKSYLELQQLFTKDLTYLL